MLHRPPWLIGLILGLILLSIAPAFVPSLRTPIAAIGVIALWGGCCIALSTYLWGRPRPTECATDRTPTPSPQPQQPVIRIPSVIGGGNFALSMHTFLGMVERYGGTLRSRLVSEEDIELIFDVCFTEPVILEFNGERDSFDTGDSIHLTWMLHANPNPDGQGDLSPELLTRFRASRPHRIP
jgi:hypothetical protein